MLVFTTQDHMYIIFSNSFRCDFLQSRNNGTKKFLLTGATLSVTTHPKMYYNGVKGSEALFNYKSITLMFFSFFIEDQKVTSILRF